MPLEAEADAHPQQTVMTHILVMLLILGLEPVYVVMLMLDGKARQEYKYIKEAHLFQIFMILLC